MKFPMNYLQRFVVVFINDRHQCLHIVRDVSFFPCVGGCNFPAELVFL